MSKLSMLTNITNATLDIFFLYISMLIVAIESYELANNAMITCYVVDLVNRT